MCCWSRTCCCCNWSCCCCSWAARFWYSLWMRRADRSRCRKWEWASSIGRPDSRWSLACVNRLAERGPLPGSGTRFGKFLAVPAEDAPAPPFLLRALEPPAGAVAPPPGATRGSIEFGAVAMPSANRLLAVGRTFTSRVVRWRAPVGNTLLAVRAKAVRSRLNCGPRGHGSACRCQRVGSGSGADHAPRVHRGESPMGLPEPR